MLEKCKNKQTHLYTTIKFPSYERTVNHYSVDHDIYIYIYIYTYMYMYTVYIYMYTVYIYMAKCSLVSSTNTLDCNPTWLPCLPGRTATVYGSKSWSQRQSGDTNRGSSILKDLSTKPAGSKNSLLNFWNRKDPKSKKTKKNRNSRKKRGHVPQSWT